jgi:catechol 2,3-dioxygenase-like lactoylglutathione lyase family enzyme
MPNATLRFVGVELDFEDLAAAREFCQNTLGLELADEEAGHHARFDGGAGFVCLERKGVESYPSHDKAVLLLETPDLRATVEAIGRDRFVGFGTEDTNGQVPWGVLHDPEGHNVLLIQTRNPR